MAIKKYVSRNTLENSILTALVLSMGLALYLTPDLAFAAGGGGFASEVKSMMENIKTGLLSIIAVVATIALIWTFVEGFMGRKTWADVFTQCAWIIGAAAAGALATWVFDAGKKISF
ncbi:TrbC/VirB2 family protein [Brackiella oedipodis]|uniref:TrbC/VirB2 family protein n=1 Tax=Brackiella oedipodis TaxID=124225 RepID=UPI00048E81C7|nr:TrbC/VirB2 family protein [Brackiella oedipodis]